MPGIYSISIGDVAGQTGQGTYSIAIGQSAGSLNQHANSIILNASGFPLNNTTTGLFVNPIRAVTNMAGGVSGSLWYNTMTNEICYNP